ncbi:hypothetical protein ACUNIU_09010 [Serratia sp. IR-2025]
MLDDSGDIFRQQFNISSPSVWQMVKAVAQGGIAVVKYPTELAIAVDK